MKSPSQLAAAALCLFGITSTLAQVPAGLVPVKGEQFQRWLDQRTAWAGFHHTSGCYFMGVQGKAGLDSRALFLRCPAGAYGVYEGVARVAGDALCTRYTAPGTEAEQCYTWYLRPDGSYEEYLNGKPVAVLRVMGIGAP